MRRAPSGLRPRAGACGARELVELVELVQIGERASSKSMALCSKTLLASRKAWPCRQIALSGLFGSKSVALGALAGSIWLPWALLGALAGSIWLP